MRKAARRLRHYLRVIYLPIARTRLLATVRSRRARAISRQRRHEAPGLNDILSTDSSAVLVPPRDARGVLQADPDDSPDSVDVIVCVRDALTDLHRCLSSVLDCSDRPLRLIVVDDGSGEETADYLDRFKAANPAIDLRRNPGPAHGYTLAANVGLRASTAEQVILLNSDAIVTRGWLGRLLAAARTSADVGIVGPLSNAASYQSVPELRHDGGWAVNELPPWLTPDGMAALVAELSGEVAIDVPFLNGFCYCIKRRVIEEVGFLDEERFADGYSEENDYSRRAAEAGFSLVVAARAYVAHAKSRSYGRQGRSELAKRNYQRFLSKHGAERIQPLVEDLEGNASLAALRKQVAEAAASPGATAARLRRIRVTFVLPGIAKAGSGGSHSIYQEAAAMRSLGLSARIAVSRGSWERVGVVYPASDDLFVAYEDEGELERLLAGEDVAVATHFQSVPSVARIAGRAPVLGAYYVQDYEPLFVSGGSPDALAASASYRMIPDGVLFAKTDWLRDTLHEREGVAVAKVEPSLDRDLFHPVGRAERDRRAHIVAMLRPRTPRRAPRETLDVLAQVAKTHGRDLRITTFGCDSDDLATLGAIPSAIDHRGLLSRQDVAHLLRTADVFLDCSWYQAFGRTSLEAMACGATAVLPQVGGVGEFAEHGVNALLVDTLSRDRTYAALTRLIEDRQLLDELQAAATRTARRYDTTKAALSEYTLFCHELASRGEREPSSSVRHLTY